MKTHFTLEKENDMLKLVLSIEELGERDVGGEKFKNVVGLVEKNLEYGPVEYGFVFTIDMSYKGKPDQYTEYFLYLTPFMEYNEFKDMCAEKGIPIAYSARR